MFIEEKDMDFAKWASEHQLVRVVAGSRLYGTARADSDFDYRGVCLDPPESLFGIVKFGQQEHVTREHDEVTYGAIKFLWLVKDCNPSILDILFAPPEATLLTTPLWEKISLAGSTLLSQKVRHTFSGYAYSQLKRIQRHKAWLDREPPIPTPEEYGLYLHNAPHGAQSLEPILERYGIGDMVKRRRIYKPADKSGRLARYKAAQAERKKYEEWRRSRNAERAELEAMYGYDVKHAAHLVRLLVQGEYILRFGTYYPRLTGTRLELVQDVLHGRWSYERLVDYAQEQERVVKSIDSVLPRSPNMKVFDYLLREVAIESLLTDARFVDRVKEEACNNE